MIFEGTKNQFFFGLELTRAGKSTPTLSRLVILACLYDCSLDELVVTYQRSRESAERDQLVPPLQLQYLYDNRTNIQKKECSFFLFARMCQGTFFVSTNRWLVAHWLFLF